MASDRLWFFTQYVALFLTIPLLNRLIATFDKCFALTSLLIGFVFLSLYPTIVGTDLFHVHHGYSFLWFVYLYLCGAVISRFFSDKSFRWGWMACLILPILGIVGRGVQNRILSTFALSPADGWGDFWDMRHPLFWGRASVSFSFFPLFELKERVLLI